MTYRVRNIFVAVGLAVVAALLTTFYVANYKRHVRQAESTVTVYVAKKDIPAGTPGTELAKHGWLSPADVAQRTVVPGAISNPDQVARLVSTQTVYTGEQITLRRFASNAQLGIRSQLRGPLRAISLPGSFDQLLAGTLKDGDHVDVIANLRTGSCNTCFATRDVVQNLLVLHAPPAGAPTKGTGTTSTSAVLAVSDRREAQKVFFAAQNAAGWTLQLRPVTNVTQPPIDVEGTASMFKDGVTPANLRHYTGAGK
ncbi:MAG TPA: Flp pilus assembly protein CpaB [Gaiellaceae bacterium]|jgi:Flp pilus assembly protein CpaB|nr:Flp pilus assembly protein CpaB [Gaiellaceae bacterium]